MKKWSYLLAVFLVLAACVCQPTAFADKATTSTHHLEQVTEIVYASNACVGSVKGTLTYDGVVHVTETQNSYHETILIHGTSVVESQDSSFPTFSGRFSELSRVQITKGSNHATFVVTQTGPNMKFHITFQSTIGPAGDVKVSVFNVTCGK